MKHLVFTLTATLMGGCSSTEFTRVEVEGKTFAAAVSKLKEVTQRRNVVQKSDVCGFSVKAPDGNVHRFRAVAADKGNWRGQSPFSACRLMEEGDKVVVSLREDFLVTTSTFGGEKSSLKVGEHWWWKFGETTYTFN